MFSNFIEWLFLTLDYAIYQHGDSLGTLGLFLVAISGLYAWKVQHLTDLKLKYLEELNQTIHRFIQEFSQAVEFFSYIKIGISAYTSTKLPGDTSPFQGFSRYVQNQGVQNAEKLNSYLNESNESYRKLQFLLVKGQIYNFTEYYKIQNAIRLLTWQHDRLSAFLPLMSSPSYNLENKKVQSVIKKLIKLDSDTIKNDIVHQSVEVTEFCKAQLSKLLN